MGDELRWEPAFATGFEEIDEQHRLLLRLINKVITFGASSSSRRLVRALLEELELYTRFHFKSEETMMILVEYPGRKAHQRAHRLLLADLAERIAAVETGDLDLPGLRDHLAAWFGRHTAESDQELGAFLHAEGIEI